MFIIERIDELLIRIKETCQKENKIASGLTLEHIKNLVKDLYGSPDDLANSLRVLVKTNQLNQTFINQNVRFIPTFLGERRFEVTIGIKDNNGDVTDDKIFRVIRLMKRPAKPEEIAEQYRLIIGPGNYETITRKIRRFANPEDPRVAPTLLRNEKGEYYMPEGAEKAVTLSDFTGGESE